MDGQNYLFLTIFFLYIFVSLNLVLMNANNIDEKKILFGSIIIIVLKSLFFLTNHIQEDALISWRVARNIIEY